MKYKSLCLSNILVWLLFVDVEFSSFSHFGFLDNVKFFCISRICCRSVKFSNSNGYEIKTNFDQLWVYGIWITVLFIFPILTHLSLLTFLLLTFLFAALVLFHLININILISQITNLLFSKDKTYRFNILDQTRLYTESVYSSIKSRFIPSGQPIFLICSITNMILVTLRLSCRASRPEKCIVTYLWVNLIFYWIIYPN